MSVIYKVVTRPTDPRVPNSPKRFYPHLITLGQSVSLKYLAEKMRDRSSLSVGDIKSVIQNFVDKMISLDEYLKKNSVVVSPEDPENPGEGGGEGGGGVTPDPSV